jgi:thymidylate synthase (FAD)
MNVRLIAKTHGYAGTEYEGKSLDEITVGIARLSSSREVNELFDEPYKLLRHCVTNQHWSVFTTTNLVFEIITSRAMGRELLRHWTLKPQELSQRYAEITQFEDIEIRKQATNNRQSSTEEFDPVLTPGYGMTAREMVRITLSDLSYEYKRLLEAGVARECARMILPETTQTKIIFNGTLREWVTTLNQRLHRTAQKEVRLVAEAIRDCFIQEAPIISKAFFNFEDAYDIHLLERVVLEKYGVYQQVKSNLK